MGVTVHTCEGACETRAFILLIIHGPAQQAVSCA